MGTLASTWKGIPIRCLYWKFWKLSPERKRFWSRYQGLGSLLLESLHSPPHHFWSHFPLSLFCSASEDLCCWASFDSGSSSDKDSQLNIRDHVSVVVCYDRCIPCSVWKVFCSVWKVFCSPWKVFCSVWKVYCPVWKVFCSAWKVFVQTVHSPKLHPLLLSYLSLNIGDPVLKYCNERYGISDTLPTWRWLSHFLLQSFAHFVSSILHFCKHGQFQWESGERWGNHNLKTDCATSPFFSQFLIFNFLYLSGYRSHP